MQTLVVVAGFNDHPNALEEISIAWKTLLDKLKDKFNPERLIIPKTLIFLESQTFSKIHSMNDVLTDVLKGENINFLDLNEVFFPGRLQEEVVFFKRLCTSLLFGQKTTRTYFAGSDCD